jgi:hypothetical protein
MADDRRSQTVQLGCGTLILIAVIVAFFSHSTTDVEREVRDLRSDVKELKRSVDAQSDEIKALREKLDKGKP